MTSARDSSWDNEAIEVPVCRLDPSVELPSYAYQGDAGLDLRANEDVELAPFERRLISTGLAIAIPEGYAGFVQPRSGLALKQGLSMANTPGLIDSHYRGELKVCAINLDPRQSISIHRGDRIAQLVIQAVPRVRLVERDSLDRTDRGSGGFGSSGIAH
jgi:dUTP pyrophosphatase